MSGKVENQKEKEALVREFLELELLHLIKSGAQNPKIIEHFMQRVKKFLGLPDDEVFPTIIQGDVESVRNLLAFISRLKISNKELENNVNKLQKQLDELNISGRKPSETPAQTPIPDKPGSKPNI